MRRPSRLGAVRARHRVGRALWRGVRRGSACGLAAWSVAGCAAPPAVPVAPAVDLVIAATTDVHGRVRGWDYYANRADPVRGLAQAATVVDSVRRAAPGRLVLVDAGDLLQGNPLAYVAARVRADDPHPVIAAMNAMGYDAAAVGNHEFNYGLPTLERAAAQARFPFLAANAVRPTGARAFPAYRIVERAGVRVGIVGATTPGSMLWDRDNIAGRLTITDIVPAVRAAVGEARAAGAGVIVVVVHSGLNEPSSYDTVLTRVPSENVAARLAHEVPGIDVIVYGHSHREMADTTIGATLLVQPKNWAASVAVAHLGLARTGEGWTVRARRGALVPVAGHVESARVVDLTRRAHEATVAYVTTPIGRTPVAWRADSARVIDTPLVDFILEVERRVSGADLASTAAFNLDATLGPGTITVAQLAQLYPYDNTLRALRISGRQLREYLEHSARYYRSVPPSGPPAPGLVDPSVPGYNFDIVAGAEYVLDLSRPVGSRVTRLAVRGRAVAETDTFTLALNNYRQTGGGGYAMLRGAPVVYDRQQEIRQLLIDEVQRRGTIEPADYFTANWRLEPRWAVGAALAMMRSLPGEGGGPSVPAPSRADRAGSVSRVPAAASEAVSPPRRLARRLRIIATNDFHGALEPRPDSSGARRGGAAYVATAIERARRECAPCATVLVDAGDLFQGTPASNLTFGHVVVELFNALGYAATALGNHEFDWGIDTLRARMREARFAIMGANVRDAAGRDVAWIPDDTIVVRDGVRVGIVGVATTSTPRTTKAGNVVGLRFDSAAAVVDARARSLRARGADAVIVLAHAGAFCTRASAASAAASCSGEIVDLARAIREPVDAIVSGHTHSLVQTVVNGIPIVQAESSGRSIGVLDLGPAPGGEPVPSVPEVRRVVTDSIEPDARVAAMVQRAVAAVSARMAAPVTSVAVTLRRTGPQYPLGNLIADAQRAAGHADAAVTNNGGIRADLRAGPVTYGDLFEVQPFGNGLVSLTVRGADLRAYLAYLVDRGPVSAHVSGLRAVYAPDRPRGARLVSVSMADGRALADSATYTVVMSDFLATGDTPLAGRALAIRSLGVTDLDALVAYLRARPRPLPVPEPARLVAMLP